MAVYDHNQGFDTSGRSRESPEAYGYFVTYMELGRSRSYGKVGEIVSTTEGNIRKFAKKYNWRERCAQYDADQVRANFADAKAESQKKHKAAIKRFRDEQMNRAQGMGDLADLMMELTAEKLMAMRAAGELPSEQSISNLAKTVASLADMAMNLQATGLGIDELVDTLETELGE
ncbi:hypothetical protein [Synechococcus sp. SYN20]|uniref:hypothetical protein n=1 Tax=Synechococcus sp. SYN20 TaxID=1050714 RepID=UPI001648874E|nr:hypothetical protein [Synechococcus sp. SYN20]